VKQNQIPGKMLTAHQDQQLEKYSEMLKRYHKTLDLISSKALEQLSEKLQDSLAYPAALSQISRTPESILDLGSGAGLPGIVTAIALPQCQVTLVERRQKRAAFLRIVKAQLGLSNVLVAEADVRAVHVPPVSAITALAVGSFLHLYCLTRHLHRAEIWLLSRKGEVWKQEIDELETVLKLPIQLVTTTALSRHGSLIGVCLGGGQPCPSSA
jgi:16S rRNA (guanine527-N7)-methyltransferase